MENFINNLPALTGDDLKVIGGILSTSGVVAIVTQFVKHKFDLAEAKRFVISIVGILAVLGSLADWYISSSSLTPAHYAGKYAGWILSGAVLLHQFLVSPFYQAFLKKLAIYNAGKIAITPVTKTATTNQPANMIPSVFVNPKPSDQAIEDFTLAE